MYLVVIAWLYVVLMMSIAEATNSTGTILGALVTFVLYGAGPVALVAYLLGAPARRGAIKKRNAQALQEHLAKAAGDSAPHAGPAACEKAMPPKSDHDL